MIPVDAVERRTASARERSPARSGAGVAGSRSESDDGAAQQERSSVTVAAVDEGPPTQLGQAAFAFGAAHAARASGTNVDPASRDSARMEPMTRRRFMLLLIPWSERLEPPACPYDAAIPPFVQLYFGIGAV
jgi:hypothetical protein